MLGDPVYLDFNATTPIAPEVVEAMLPYLTTHFGNPSSEHVYGRRARQAVARAREQVAGLIGAHPEEIIFTGSGTEANNLAILGITGAYEQPRSVACSAIEHPSVLRACEQLRKQLWTTVEIPVAGDGRVEPGAAAASWPHDVVLVSVMHSNNEVGTLQPIKELAGLAKSRGTLIHSDAAQSVGKLPVDVRELGVDALTIVGHKIYAPKGVGALYVRRGVPLMPVSFGGGQEGGLRSGTENVALIAALGAACELAARRLADDQAHLRALRDRLWGRLAAAIPALALNGHPDERLPNTLNVSFPAVRGSAVLAAAPGVAASTGSACHEGGETPSGVLSAMGCDAERALGAVRLSVGRTTSEEEVDRAAAELVRAWRNAAGREPGR